MTRITADHDAYEGSEFTLPKETVEAVLKYSGSGKVIYRLSGNPIPQGPTRLQAALSLHSRNKKAF